MNRNMREKVRIKFFTKSISFRSQDLGFKLFKILFNKTFLLGKCTEFFIRKIYISFITPYNYKAKISNLYVKLYPLMNGV